MKAIYLFLFLVVVVYLDQIRAYAVEYPETPGQQSENAYNRHLKRVVRQMGPPPPPGEDDMPPPPDMKPPPEMEGMTPPSMQRKKREAKGGGAMPTRKG